MYLWYILLTNGLYQIALMELYKDMQAKGTRVPAVLCSGGSSIASTATGDKRACLIYLPCMDMKSLKQSTHRGFHQQVVPSEIDGLMLELTQLKDQHALLRQTVSIMKKIVSISLLLLEAEC